MQPAVTSRQATDACHLDPPTMHTDSLVKLGVRLVGDAGIRGLENVYVNCNESERDIEDPHRVNGPELIS